MSRTQIARGFESVDVRVGFGRRGGLAAKRRRTTLTGGADVVGGGVGAPSVTWVLDERGVVGDNNRVWVSPGWECDRVSVMRLSSTSAGEHAGCRS